MSSRARKVIEKLLSERDWKVSLGVDLDSYDEDEDFEVIKADIIKKLKDKMESVRDALGDSEAEALDLYISNLEDAVDVEDFDSVFSDIYDWADSVGIWVG